MPILHERNSATAVVVTLLVAACLSLGRCGGAAPTPYHAPPVPLPSASVDYPEEPPETVAAAPSPQADDPIPSRAVSSPPAATSPEPPTVAAKDPDWADMTSAERATRLHFEGLQFEANRVASQVAGTEEAAEEPTVLEELTETVIPDDTTIAQSREDILRKTKSDLPLVLNANVIKLINYFSTGRGRKTFLVTTGRGGAYKEMIERILEEEDVPKELFHLAQAESGFVTKARSWARATGMWQFVSFRGRQYGLRQGREVEERYDPEKATRAAARHLKDLFIEFDDWYLAMAAYNSGPERVRRAIARSGSRDYWELCRRSLLPRETRNYIPIILAFTYVNKNLDLYEFGDIQQDDPLRYDTVPSHSETSLQLIADLTDSSVAAIRDLNPALLRSATPPFDYSLRLPLGTAERFTQELALIPSDQRLNWRRLELGEGETLAAIAKRFSVAESEILAVNAVDPESLTAGSRLTIPAKTRLEIYGGGGQAGGSVEGGSGRYRIARGDTLGAIATRFGISVRQLMAWNGLSSSRIRAGRYLVVQTSGSGNIYASSNEDPGPAPSGRYTVRRGDTLSSIAAHHGATVGALTSWNNLRTTRINVGQVLRVPGAGAPAAAVASSTTGGEYRIRRGDNLASIAGRFGVSVDDLRRWNGLRGTRINAGDTLRISAAPSAPSKETLRAAAEFSTESHPEPPPSRTPGQRYRIQRGDSLIEIARRFDVTVEDLRSWNGLRGNRITAGEYLNVGSALVAARPAASSSPPTAASGGERYQIGRGDNLATIARRFDVSVEDLQKWNGLSGTRITAGEYLVIRGASTPSAGQYRIRSGDTLGAIAERFGVTVEQLRIWNGLRGNRINEGSYLTVRPAATNNVDSRRLASAGSL